MFYDKVYLKYLKRLQVVKPLNYFSYNNISAAKILTQKNGWKCFLQKHFESCFTKFLESYWLPSKFSFDVSKHLLSSLILNDQIRRAEALLMLENPPYDKDAIKHEFEYVATKLGIFTN